MKFVADESVDGQIVDRLREEGYFVWYVAEMEPGISDEEVIDLANRKKALLLTADKEFGELVFQQKRLNPGVVLIRLAGFSSIKKAEIVYSAIQKHISELSEVFAVITPGIIRIRRSEK